MIIIFIFLIILIYTSIKEYCKQVKHYNFPPELLKSCPSIFSYNPSIFFCGFLHTILQIFLPDLRQLFQIKEDIYDNGVILNWIITNYQIDSKYSNVLLLILPGVTGSIEDKYIQHLIHHFLNKGFPNICLYQFRVLSKYAQFNYQSEFNNYRFEPKYYQENNLQRIDPIADFHDILIQLNSQYKQIYAIGCSYGGIQLVNYLGSFNKFNLIQGAVGVCVPLDLVENNKKVTWLMDKLVNNFLKRKFQDFSYKFKNRNGEYQINIDKVMRSKTVQEFDEAYAIKIYGYKNTECYYKHMSGIRYLYNDDIKTRLLILQAEDDGVVHIDSTQIQMIPKNIQICVSKKGGHVGFLEGFRKTWFPNLCCEYIVAQINESIIN